MEGYIENPFLRGALTFQTITSFFEDSKPVLDFLVFVPQSPMLCLNNISKNEVLDEIYPKKGNKK